MDLLVTFDYGMITIEDMSTKARAGLRRHSDVKSMFYFFKGDFEIKDDNDYYYITGNRKGMFGIPENQILPREIIDTHDIPTARLKKAIRTPLDLFRKNPSCFISDDRMVVPLHEVHKHVTITVPKSICVRLKQSEWYMNEEGTGQH